MSAVFVNTGPFWDKYPDVYSEVTRFTSTDINGDLVEAWERDANGVMVDVTEREKAYQELERAQEAMSKFFDEEDDDDYDND